MKRRSQSANAGQGISAGRRERERQVHRQAMLEAAEAVFAEKGYEHTTMEEVARRAEFSVGALYNFFKNKEALFGEVIRGIAGNFYAGFREDVDQADTPLDAIRRTIGNCLGQIERHGPFFRTVLATKAAATVCPDSAIPPACRAIYDRYVADLGELFARAMKQGQIRRLDPLYAALALEGVIHAYSAFWHRTGARLSLKEKERHVTRNFLDALLIPSRRT